MARIRQARVVDGRSHQEIAHERNEAGMPTFSGQGTWQKGTAERFYQRKPNYRPVVEQLPLFSPTETTGPMEGFVMDDPFQACQYFQCDQRATTRFIWPNDTVYYCASHTTVAETNYQRWGGPQPMREEGEWRLDLG